MDRYCMTLDLKQDAGLIAEYIEHHRVGWPEIHQSIRAAGVLDMQIYELEGRLFMIMDTVEGFSFDRKAAMDEANPMVQEWEKLMARYQDVSADAAGDAGKKWRKMQKIFQLRPAEPDTQPSA